jgi:hypothetical protein
MKHQILALLSAVLLLASCKKDKLPDPVDNTNVNANTTLTITEENNPTTYILENPQKKIQLIEGDKLRITITDVYPNNKALKINIAVNGIKGPGKYEVKEGATGVVTMTDDNETYLDDVYWSNYYKVSGYGSYNYYYSPKVFLEVTSIANGKLSCKVDMLLWHDIVYSVRDLYLKGTITGAIE